MPGRWPAPWPILPLLLDVVSGPDARDCAALPPITRSYFGSLDSGVLGLRIALSPTWGYVDVDPDVSDAAQTAAYVFRDLGAEVEIADPGLVEYVQDFHVLWFAALAKAVGRLTSREANFWNPGSGRS